MAKIYLTGMTAPQASPSANVKCFSFAGVLNKVLTDAGHQVTWEDPDLNKTFSDLDQFDAVLVGVGPITSIGANRVYGALSIIDLLWSSTKLSLFIDAPNTVQILNSLKAIESNPSNLLKEFYSYRKGYATVVSDVAISSRISNATNRLMNEEWPTTIYPNLPWKTDQNAGKKLPKNALKNFLGLNFDSHFLVPGTPVVAEKREKWVVDTLSNKDTKKLTATLAFPTLPMKWNKGWTDEQVVDQIQRSSGAIVSPYRGDGTWWSFRYVQAMNASTPVYSDWTETSTLGSAWGYLAQAIEDLSHQEKLMLSTEQMLSYLEAIPDRNVSTKNLETALRVSSSKE